MKEHGKLTADQFKGFIAKLPEIRRQRDEFGNLLAELSNEKFNKLMVSGFSWGEIYEYSFTEHIAVAIVAFKMAGWLSNLTATEDPQKALLDSWPESVNDDDAHPSFLPQDLIG